MRPSPLPLLCALAMMLPSAHARADDPPRDRFATAPPPWGAPGLYLRFAVPVWTFSVARPMHAIPVRRHGALPSPEDAALAKAYDGFEARGQNYGVGLGSEIYAFVGDHLVIPIAGFELSYAFGPRKSLANQDCALELEPSLMGQAYLPGLGLRTTGGAAQFAFTARPFIGFYGMNGTLTTSSGRSFPVDAGTSMFGARFEMRACVPTTSLLAWCLSVIPVVAKGFDGAAISIGIN